MRKKGSLIFLKLGTLKVHVKLILLNFDFSRENLPMGLKIDFEFFEVGQIYKRFPANNFYKGISFINFDFSRSQQFSKEFPYKICIRGFLL